MYVMSDGGDDAQAVPTTERRSGRARTATGENPPTERHQHAKGSERIPTSPPIDSPPIDSEVIELDDTIRKTEKMSASHFRSMLGPTAMLSHLPSIPPLETLPPPIEHEEVASSKLMDAALAQIKAGARLRLETDADDLVDDERPVRSAPTTLPISNQRLAEITATADTRPAIAMPPLARPAEPTPESPTPDARATSDADAVNRPLQRMQRLPRLVDEPITEPPRPDAWMLFATCLLVVALFATVALLLTR